MPQLQAYRLGRGSTEQDIIRAYRIAAKDMRAKSRAARAKAMAGDYQFGENGLRSTRLWKTCDDFRGHLRLEGLQTPFLISEQPVRGIVSLRDGLIAEHGEITATWHAELQLECALEYSRQFAGLEDPTKDRDVITSVTVLCGPHAVGKSTYALSAVEPYTLIYDAPNLGPTERSRIVRMCSLYRVNVDIVCITTTLGRALERNTARERPVSEFALRDSFARYVQPSTKEGFDSYKVIRWG